MPHSKDRWAELAQRLGWTLQRLHPSAGCAELRDSRGYTLLLTHEQRDDLLEAMKAPAVPKEERKVSASRR